MVSTWGQTDPGKVHLKDAWDAVAHAALADAEASAVVAGPAKGWEGAADQDPAEAEADACLPAKIYSSVSERCMCS